MKNNNQFRQGDVFIEKVSAIPAGATKKADNIVAIGESMNHAHAMFGEAEVMEKDGELFIDVKTEAELKHILLSNGIATESWTKEHHPIILAPGKYAVTLQQQYDPFKKAAERVMD